MIIKASMKSNTITSRIIVIASIIFSVILIDQMTKYYARLVLTPSKPVSFLDGVLELTLHKNPGAFLSLGAGFSDASRFIIFAIGGCLIILVGLYYLLRTSDLSRATVIALSFVAGGAIGNQIDRFLFHGYVTDFLFLSYKSIHTGIFNIADMAVMLGVGMFFIEAWRTSQHPAVTS
jgi:signal peptidase II